MNKLHILKGYLSSSGKDEKSDSTTEAAPDIKDEGKKKNSEAVTKLNKLLVQMAEDSTNGKLELAKPASRRKRIEIPTEASKPLPLEKRLESAAKEVANEMGSNVKRVESELLSKLLEISNKDGNEATVSLSSLVKGMKIERDSKSSEQKSRSQQVKQLLSLTKRSEVKTRTTFTKTEKRAKLRDPLQGTIQKVDAFRSEPLGLFKRDSKDEGTVNNKWRALHEKELQLAVTHPASNYFQQMIQWTDAGKIWKFPIDNEQGMEEERNVYFTEHVFLEQHLEPWCPPRGPIRHFMELVCVGLSKNPYMTVETKKGHIEWYRKYFEEKMQLLREIGAIPTENQSQAAISDQ